MAYKNIDIQMILPKQVVHWKIAHCPKRHVKDNEYRISIELKDKKRQYSCISFEDLLKLIQRTPVERRVFYEHISRGDAVKFYLDFEYYLIPENTMVKREKALFSIQKLFVNTMRLVSNIVDISDDQLIFLESSSSEKCSYHVICDNERIRFIDSDSLHVFIEEVLRFILLSSLNHQCIRNRNCVVNNNNDDCSLSELMELFEHIRLECFGCTECTIRNVQLTISDVCNLFVYNRNHQLVSCIDLSVYCVEQDFRMFMCTKIGEVRPLRKSTWEGPNEPNKSMEG